MRKARVTLRIKIRRADGTEVDLGVVKGGWRGLFSFIRIWYANRRAR